MDLRSRHFFFLFFFIFDFDLQTETCKTKKFVGPEEARDEATLAKASLLFNDACAKADEELGELLSINKGILFFKVGGTLGSASPRHENPTPTGFGQCCMVPRR